MLNVVIFGAPGSGKGTQSAKIAERYGLYHVSTGEVLREEIASASKLGKLADSYMSKGQLVPDNIVIEVIAEIIEKNRNKEGFVFDGFPRTLPQGEALNMMLNKYGADVNVVLCLNVDEDELTFRLLNRGKYSGRNDDNRQTIESRLRVYQNQTAPLIEFYKAQGVLKEINGTSSVDAVFASIAEAIDRSVHLCNSSA